MDKNFTLDIISPEGPLFKGPVRSVTLPSSRGEITVLAGHAPLFTKIAGGEVVIGRDGAEPEYITVSGGFLEVSDNAVNILADFAIRSAEIVSKEAEEAKRKAEETMRQKKDKVSFLLAEKELKKFAAELKVAEKVRKRPRK